MGMYTKTMKKHRITIVSRRHNVIGRLTAHDTDTGMSLYQVDGPYQGRYRVLGLRGYLAAHAHVDSLAHARETIRLDAASGPPHTALNASDIAAFCAAR